MSYDGSAVRESKCELEEAHTASLATDTGSGKRESSMMQITQDLRTEVSLCIIGFYQSLVLTQWLMLAAIYLLGNLFYFLFCLLIFCFSLLIFKMKKMCIAIFLHYVYVSCAFMLSAETRRGCWIL